MPEEVAEVIYQIGMIEVKLAFAQIEAGTMGSAKTE